MDEDELLDRCLGDDKEAMDQLVQMHWDRVYHHCLRIVQDQAMAEDLSQETFVQAFKYLSSFQRRSRFSTWVWRIAHNLCLNYLKKRHLKDQPLIEEMLPAQLEKKESSAFLKQVEAALQTLDEKHRIVFELYDLEHLPQKEIAARLGVPHGTVRSRLHYARLRVRAYFKEHPLED